MSSIPIVSTSAGRTSAGTPPPVKLDARAPEPARALLDHLRNYAGRTLIAAESTGRREMLLDILPSIKSTRRPWMTGNRSCTAKCRWRSRSRRLRGLQLKDPPITVLAEEQLFGERAKQELAGRIAILKKSFAICRI
jgi:transcription-repair coupling factor (superfamily II helicase)